MRTVRAISLMLALLAPSLAESQETSKAADPKIETIVFIRHGETSLLGLGQITCKGLNRALAQSFVKKLVGPACPPSQVSASAYSPRPMLEPEP